MFTMSLVTGIGFTLAYVISPAESSVVGSKTWWPTFSYVLYLLSALSDLIISTHKNRSE
jgi:hypothetical protein